MKYKGVEKDRQDAEIRVGGGRMVCKGVFIPSVAVPLFFPSHFS